jgi:hypothetical protein
VERDSPWRLRRAAWRTLAAVWLLGAPAAAAAVDPVNVQVEGSVELPAGKSEGAREQAFQDGLVEAVLQVALSLLPGGGAGVDVAALREQLAPHAAEAVLTYRIESELSARRSARDPSLQEFVLRLRATVDASQIREQLRKLGVLPAPAARPSILLVVRHPPGAASAGAASVAALESYLRQRLSQQRFAVVEPALRAARGSASAPEPLALARALGADVLAEVELRWQERGAGPRALGGVAQAQARATRVRDGFELASSRFESAAYHGDPAEAQARAVDALREQVAANLLLQLERNWEALAGEPRDVDVRLSNVAGLREIEEVRQALRGPLRAERAELVELGPRSALLRVRASLSPGALGERLGRVAFDGFVLEPVTASEAEVELRRVAAEPPGAPPPAGAVP